jgi:hypothetical protein
MFYTVYKITNKLNGKFYIGKHKTEKLDDGYMGSGKLIKLAIEKHGIENFEKQILHVFQTENEMSKAEAELVVLCEDSYNLCFGGGGGFDYINNSGIIKFKDKKHREDSKKKMGHPGNKHALGNQSGKMNKGKKREIFECVHCNKKVPVNMYARYHGDKCKNAGFV